VQFFHSDNEVAGLDPRGRMPAVLVCLVDSTTCTFDLLPGMDRQRRRRQQGANARKLLMDAISKFNELAVWFDHAMSFLLDEGKR